MTRTVISVRYSMTLRDLQKALEEIGYTTKLQPGNVGEVPYLEVWK